jgi:hypothetical protein
MNEILDYLEPVTIKAGEAVFFDQSIIHFSPPNFSSDKRIVTNTYFTHQSAEYRTFYWDKDQFGNQVEAFKQDENFMIDFDQFGENIRNKPKVGQSLGLFPYDFPKINEQFLKENFKKTNARQLIKSVENAFVLSNMGSEKELKPKGIFNRLKKILFHA